MTAARHPAHWRGAELFAGGRRFSSYLGIVPGRDSSADRERQRSITKAGPSEARRLLMSVLRENLGEQMNVTLEDVDDIPLTRGGKHRVTISELPTEASG